MTIADSINEQFNPVLHWRSSARLSAVFKMVTIIITTALFVSTMR